MGGGHTFCQFTMKDYMDIKDRVNKLSGRVLILNDAFGYMTYHASRKKDVTEITLVSDDGQMNYDFLREFLVPNCKDAEKITLIQHDLSEYVKNIHPGEFDYVFANICEFASADEILIRRDLKLKQINCDYHLENHYAKNLSPTISTIIAEDFGVETEYIKNRQELLVNQEKYEFAQMDSNEDDEDMSDYEEYAFEEYEYEPNVEDIGDTFDKIVEEWAELINEMIEDTQFEVDIIKNAYSEIKVNSLKDLKMLLSTAEILKRL